LKFGKKELNYYVFVKLKLKILDSLPFKVKAQIEDSVLSCPSNIAEGYSRRSIKENINFVNIALSSLSENYTQIFALYSAVEFEKVWFDEYDKKHYSLENKLIQFNKSMISKIDQKDWNNDYILREIIEKYSDG
jgi:four helix bundle protein